METECVLCEVGTESLYRVCQEESAIHWEKDTWVKLHLYNHKHLCTKSNSYGDNCEIYSAYNGNTCTEHHITFEWHKYIRSLDFYGKENISNEDTSIHTWLHQNIIDPDTLHYIFWATQSNVNQSTSILNCHFHNHNVASVMWSAVKVKLPLYKAHRKVVFMSMMGLKLSSTYSLPDHLIVLRDSLHHAATLFLGKEIHLNFVWPSSWSGCWWREILLSLERTWIVTDHLFPAFCIHHTDWAADFIGIFGKLNYKWSRFLFYSHVRCLWCAIF